jgi:hypothetical protein
MHFSLGGRVGWSEPSVADGFPGRRLPFGEPIRELATCDYLQKLLTRNITGYGNIPTLFEVLFWDYHA